MEVEEIDFLWEPFIAKRSVTLLIGDPGVGKTYLTLYIAAQITNGTSLPAFGRSDRRSCEPGNVLFLTAEDELRSVILPRFLRLKGDVRRMSAVTGLTIETPSGKIERAVTLSVLAELENQVTNHQPTLIIIDPLQGFLGAGVDMHRANEMRPIMASLSRLAIRQNCAVIVVGHMAKANYGAALYKGLGSIDIAAASRSILLAAPNPVPVPAQENPLTSSDTRCVLSHVKSNFGEVGPSVAYHITEKALILDGPVDIVANDLIATATVEREKPRAAARNFLREFLALGPQSSKDVSAEAEARHISEATLNRAAAELGVRKHPSNTFQGPWVWELSDEIPVENVEQQSPAQYAVGDSQ